MTKRNSQATYCHWPECRGRADRNKYGFPFCGSHSRYVERRVIESEGSIADVCIFPGCSNYLASTPQTKLCSTHLAIIVRHSTSDPAVQRIMYDMRRYDEDTERRLSRQPTPEPETTGTVYFIRVGSYIKIGWTADLTKRMRQYPPDTILLAAQPGTRKDEHRLHKRFAVHRSHGREWYPLVPAILEHVEAVKREHGEPEQPTFAARPVEVPRPHTQAEYVKPKGYVTSGGKTLRG